MKNKWLKKNKDTIIKTDPSKDIQDETALNLRLLAANTPGNSVTDDEIKNLKRRKLINQVVRKSYKVQKGAEYNPVRRKRIADLTKEMFGNKAEVGWEVIGRKKHDFHIISFFLTLFRPQHIILSLSYLLISPHLLSSHTSSSHSFNLIFLTLSHSPSHLIHLLHEYT